MASPARDPKTEQVITLLTPEDRDALDALAAEERVSRSELVRAILLREPGLGRHRRPRAEMAGQLALIGDDS